MRIYRTNGIAYARAFFRNYHDRLSVLDAVLNQKRDALDDRAYMASIAKATGSAA
jgi:hypothetical protein